MTPFEVIRKKRDGLALSADEIRYMLEGMTDGRVDTYHLSAWMMAIWFRGMNDEETRELTRGMIESGEQVDLSSIPGIKVDKHSTGGVGDATTLILAPLAAAAGARVAKMSGRGLGHTGGTLDKMEAIPGMRVHLTSEQFLDQVRRIGLAVISPTARLVPADGAMYSLRDVTATIDSIPLIASSIMSKKLACGAEAILLDVKFGHGAFMQTYEQAHELARCMVAIGRGLDRRVRAALSEMDQPLGTHVGNALEVREAIEVLRGERSDSDLAQVAMALAEQLIMMSRLAEDQNSARARVRQLIDSGKAVEKLQQWLEAQGGDPRVAEDPSLLPQAPEKIPFLSPGSGYLTGFRAELVGQAAMKLGAGRARKGDPIDPAVGLVLQARLGEKVEKGQPLAVLHARGQERVDQALAHLQEAVTLGEEPMPREPLIREWVFG
ncbi:MAG: thymidine phosphorylase [Armatimonadetes bacterium]|nr:thymidine phosphorylase [Armatimonadota bacterium]